MYKDFKENYIEQQKKQAEARQARLAKIGMGTAAASNNEPQRNTVTAGRPAGAAAKPASQVQRPSARPAVRYVNDNGTKAQTTAQPSPKAAVSQSATPVKKVAPAKAPTQNSIKRPVQSEGVKQNANASSVKPSNAQSSQNKTPSTVSAAQPSQSRRPVQSAAQAQDRRPVSSNVLKPEQTQRSQTANRPSAPAQRPAVKTNAQSASYNSRRMSATDSDIFKQGLSDSESRAMMFALTGKAEQPSDGGEVDIINLGRISAPKKKKEAKKKKSKVGAFIGLALVAVVSFVLFFVIFVFASVGLVAHGPSETVRDLLVQSAMQASATKWVPYVFLPAETVDGIINKSEEVVQDIVSLEDYSSDTNSEINEDEWANAKDGMIFETVSGSTFKAYVLLVKDPSRVFCGTSTDDFSNSKAGVDVFQAAERYGAIACINAGEFLDNGGHGSGYAPLGLTYSQGKCVYRDTTPKTFMGFDNENRLIVREGMTEAEADELGIRDAVCFQNNNTLIQKEGDNIILSYEDGNAGTSQRTAIGQREDGTVILIVTDGRSASSLGATHNDMIDLMVSYGAVTAGMLDGGSSAMMYYEDYYTKYGYDVSKLDEYQKMGLVNNYKAFTEPRKIPTFFMVKPE